MGFLARCAPALLALAFGATAVSADSSYPQYIKLDLVFPLNDTYAPPDAALPFVFALAKSPAAQALALNAHYKLLDNNAKHPLENPLDEGSVHLRDIGSSGNDTFYAFNYTQVLAGKEGTFGLVTSVHYNDCHHHKNGTISADTNLFLFGDVYTFTLKKGAQAANFASTSSTSCNSHAKLNFSFNVTGVTQLAPGENSPFPVCPEIGKPDEPYDAPPQCAQTIEAAAAASIAANVSSAATAHPTTATSSPEAKKSAAAAALSSSSFAGVAAVWSMLVFGLSFWMFASS